MKRHVIIFLGVLSMLMFACENVEPCEPETSEAEILRFLEDRGWEADAERDPSGLYYIVDDPGSRIRPTVNSTVSIIYRGYLTDEDTTQFDSSNGATRTFPLSGVIQGWQIGVPLFREGGKGKLIIPCNLGYGDRVQGTIPAASVLVFDIELVDVQ